MSGALFNARKKSAVRGIPFLIDFEHLCKLVDESDGRCALSGLPFAKGPPGMKGVYSPSLDRIKPELGYVPGNVRVILDAVNGAKSTGTDEDLIMICHAVAARNPL